MLLQYITTLRNHTRGVLFGLSATFLSSFGQTFFVSLFMPVMAAAAAVGEGALGGYYSAATLVGAALLPRLGALIDRVRLEAYLVFSVGGLGLACAAAAMISGPVSLFLALFGLRFFGQGLVAHTGVTAVARRYPEKAGLMLGMISLGYPLGEGLLPLAATWSSGALGWRGAWWLAAGFCWLAALPFLLRMGRVLTGSPAAAGERSESGSRGNRRVLRRYLSDPRFWCLQPASLAFPFVVTAVLLFQPLLAEERGWSMEWIAASFLAFAFVRAVCGLLAGPWIDAFGGVRGLAWSLFPLAGALVLLAWVRQPWVVPVYLGLTGAGLGINSVAANAALLHVFSVDNLGALRGLKSAMMILSTASSPALAGWLISRGVSYETLLTGALGLVLGALLFTVAAARRMLARKAAMPG